MKELRIKEIIKCVCSTWDCEHNSLGQLGHSPSSKGIVIHDEKKFSTSIENCTAFGRHKIVPELNIINNECDSYKKK